MGFAEISLSIVALAVLLKLVCWTEMKVKFGERIGRGFGGLKWLGGAIAYLIYAGVTFTLMLGITAGIMLMLA